MATCYSKRMCKHCNGKHDAIVCSTTAKLEGQVYSDIRLQCQWLMGLPMFCCKPHHVFEEDRSAKVPVNILFDSGSQRSYVTEELKKKLSLESSGSETFNLNTFGSEKYFKKSCDRVIVNLEIRDECIPISALTSRAICSPVSSCVDIRSYPHLAGLDIANRVDGNDQHISILVCADHYHDKVLGKGIKGSAGPVAVCSKLGWLISLHVLMLLQIFFKGFAFKR